MEFLRRLAASATQAHLPGAARAALPTRFGAQASSTEVGAEETSLSQASTPRAPSRDAYINVPPNAAVRSVESQPSYLRQNQRATGPLPVAAAHSSPLKPDAADARSGQASPDPNSPQILERLTRVERRLDAKRVATPQRDEDVNPESASDAIARAIEPVSADNPRQGPLSQSAVSSRLLPQDERTIVHVTIDRIDVRAPSAQPQPPAARPAQKAASSVSLSTYLRGSRSSGETP
jgi:hypothetical protein